MVYAYSKYSIYYVKVSGIPSGNKLIKTIRYPHMWRYDIFTCEDIDDFTDIKFVSLLYLNLLVYHRYIFRSSSKVFGTLWKFPGIFRNSQKMFGNVRLTFGTILENLRKSSGSGRKSSENRKKRRRQEVYIIKRTLHVSSKIWILCSCGKNNILRVSAANEWNIVRATRK